MSFLSSVSVALLGVAVLGGCAPAESPELACQKRLGGAPGGDGLTTEETLARFDRAGCTARQLSVLDRKIVLTRSLPALTAANEKAAASGDEAAHMTAFQQMNDAVIELNALQQSIETDLAALEPTK